MPVELMGGMKPESEVSDKIFCLVHGYSGVGKSGFCLSCPPNWWMVNCDRAIGQLSAQLPPTSMLTYEAIQQDVDTVSPAIARNYLMRFDVVLNRALAAAKLAAAKGERPGTFILDGADNFWEYVKIAKVPNYLDGVDAPKEYAPANTYMDNMLARLGMSPINVAFTVFSSRVWTGMKKESERVKAVGYKHMERYLTHEIYMYSPDDTIHPLETPEKTALGQNHRAVITRSKLNEKLINLLIPNITFGMLYRLTFGAAYPEAERLWSPARAAAAVTESEPTS